MSRHRLCSLAVILLAGATPTLAGTVYVPLPGIATVGDAQWEPTVFASNSDDEEQVFKQLFLAADTDGTERDGDPTSQPVAPGVSTGLLPAADAAGLLELDGADPLAFSAKLVRVGQPDSVGTHLPVLSSENLFEPDGVAFVQGIRRSASAATDWVLVNLGHAPAQCRLRVFASGGGQLGATATVPMLPLSMRTYADFLASFAIDEAANVRVDASCDQRFYSFALTRDTGTGDIAFLGPSGEGSSTLRLPGEEEEEECPPTASCFRLDGVVHSPTPAHAVQRHSFDVPPGSYKRIHLEMDVFHGGFAAANPAGLHMLFWLVKNRNFYMYGYSCFEGPNDNQIMFRHGVELTHPQKIRILKAFASQPGHTYHLDYTYDAEQQFLEMIVSEGGEERARLRGTPNVSSIAVNEGDLFHIDIGFNEGLNPNELPTYGWIYRDLRLNFLR